MTGASERFMWPGPSAMGRGCDWCGCREHSPPRGFNPLALFCGGAGAALPRGRWVLVPPQLMGRSQLTGNELLIPLVLSMDCPVLTLKEGGHAIDSARLILGRGW